MHVCRFQSAPQHFPSAIVQTTCSGAAAASAAVPSGARFTECRVNSLVVMRTLVKVALAAALVAVTVAVIAQPKPEPKKEEEKKIAVKVTPEMIRHSRIVDTLYFVGTAYSIGVLALLLLSGASRKMRDLAARISR